MRQYRNGEAIAQPRAQEGHSGVVLRDIGVAVMVGGFGRGVSHDVFVSDAECWASEGSGRSSNATWTHVDDRSGRLGLTTYGHTSAAVGPRAVGVFGGCTGGGYTDDVNDLLVLHLVGDLPDHGASSSAPPVEEATCDNQRLPVPGQLGIAIAEAQRQLQQQEQDALQVSAQTSEPSDNSGDGGGISRSYVGNKKRLSGFRAIWQRPVLTEHSAIPTARAYASVTPVSVEGTSSTTKKSMPGTSTKSVSSTNEGGPCPVPASQETLLVFGGIHDEEATASFEVAELSIQPTASASDSRSNKTKIGNQQVEESASDSSSAGSKGPIARCHVTWRVPRIAGEPPCARFGHAAVFVPNANSTAPRAPSFKCAGSPMESESSRSHFDGHDRSHLGRLIVCGGSNGSDLLRNGSDLTDVFVLTWHGPAGDGAESDEETYLGAEDDERDDERASYVNEGAHMSDASSSSNRRRSSQAEVQPPRSRTFGFPKVEGSWSEVSTHWRAGHVYPPGGLYMGRCCSSASREGSAECYCK